jgi:hypothetical protein
MIEGLIDIVTRKQPTPSFEGATDESVEKVALAGAAAIQRLIDDRDRLRNCASAQLQDLVALSTINKELRNRLVLIRRHYLELGTAILGQLEQFEKTTREAMLDTQDTASGPSDDGNLVALAQRLKPNVPRSDPSPASD